MSSPATSIPGDTAELLVCWWPWPWPPRFATSQSCGREQACNRHARAGPCPEWVQGGHGWPLGLGMLRDWPRTTPHPGPAGGLQQGRGLQQGPRLHVRSGAPLPGLRACDPSGRGGRWRLPRSSLPPADCSSTREYWLAFGQESKGKGREGNEKQTWRGILFIYLSLLLFLAVLHNLRDPKFPN